MELKWTSQFKKDHKKIKKQGKDLQLLQVEILEPLLEGKQLKKKSLLHRTQMKILKCWKQTTYRH